jgi:excisionase family DNA binding protein
MTERGKAGSYVIGEGFLTLREATEVLRLSIRTARSYVKRGEIKGKIIGKRWRFRRADIDAFFETHPLSGTSLERAITGTRRWGSDNKGADGTATSLVSGRGLTVITCPSSSRGSCEAISTIRAEFPICWSSRRASI